ncbi:hydroxyisourate hydrolase [Histidinibacterium aquaticum]|uniref:5-hydroxyisourate hydrolase n=1 Tax=Histidinibacterium aquaticum TaxID=2613962 RepID=A0A5J5GQD8_9RHOB|nr:hydroxyisourate hydrolase [Histidinibacterium aquaticum]KAA9010461.1 hydroxyisourate hydrolase [Histidinibacterium aquaticum]
MSGYLTTHVLDTARGVPAEALRVELFRLTGGRAALADMLTNADGRTGHPILPEDDFTPGKYELVFHAGEYHRGTDQPGGFLDDVVIRFVMDERAHYHVPLLLSPFGYSTYRGS